MTTHHHESSQLPTPATETGKDDPIRLFSRSPHPYHHRKVTNPDTSSSSLTSSNHQSLRFTTKVDTPEQAERLHPGRLPSWRGTDVQDYTNSDSGTEADDEHFLKGLPAPKLRPHKGLRGTSDATGSRTPSPMPSPALYVDENSKLLGVRRTGSSRSRRNTEEDIIGTAGRARRKRGLELLRRGTEIALLGALGLIVTSDKEVKALLWKWRKEFSYELLTIGGLFLLYPLRIIHRPTRTDGLEVKKYFAIPTSFDPAPLIYPPVLAAYVALLLSRANPAVLLPNMILGIASLPPDLIPSIGRPEGYSVLHWFLSCIPLLSYTYFHSSVPILGVSTFLKTGSEPNISVEVLSSLYPLHYFLCVTLHYLTTTSLLPAELHLLSIALINVLLLASSPQIVILKSLLWGGGIGVLVTCEPVIRWGVALARVPRWRFKRAENTHQAKESPYSENVNPRRRSIVGKLQSLIPDLGSTSENSDDEELIASQRLQDILDVRRGKGTPNRNIAKSGLSSPPASGVYDGHIGNLPNTSTTANADFSISSRQRRHTLPSILHPPSPPANRTPSGRKKRTASSSIQPFFSFTHREAILRKWIYAAYVYICVVLIILGGIRHYVGSNALNDHEPIGWALGYLFGNIPWFRFQVVSNNLERWICLPSLSDPSSSACILGSIPRLRQITFGEANTRLLLVIYYFLAITTGLLVVFRLSKVYEVDTRRKVFHFMMVFILLPTTFVDPTFCSLALSLILAIFLLLDLFRASQLPPLSKPIAYFLTPYVDGRDLRGPVVVSHIFLLIGCAVPLWLSLGSLDRTGEGLAEGWEIETRDVSMVSGVICVGMGDAAASLIGRRFGKHKWIWPGGKSIEGSVAFAFAVAFGLTLSKIWLRVGGWIDGSGPESGIAASAMKISIAASGASLAEAVLTGGNDNVVVPVVLWLCVKGLGI